jgi:2'-5' RNA ligase
VNLRLFVALEPPDAVRRRLAAVQEATRVAAGAHAAEIRWAPAVQVHLTLQFLGAVPEERLEAVRAAVREAAAASRPLRLAVHGAGGFPSSRRPRVVWAGVEDDAGGLAALAAGLGRALAPLGFPAEGRPFSPHLTLGRSRDPRGARGLGGAITAASALEPVPWRATEVVLFRSTLGPGGARHDPVERMALGVPAGGTASPG